MAPLVSRLNPPPNSATRAGPKPSLPAASTPATTASPTTATPMQDISRYGDIKLIIKTTKGITATTASYRVSSHALMGASLFFEKLLDPDSAFEEARRFSEHKLRESFPLHLDLESFQLDACELVLKQIHGKLTPEPEGLAETATTDNFYELARLADYLGCEAALLPWVAYLLELDPTRVHNHPDFGSWREPSDIDKCLFIAFTFRHDALFRMSTRKCIHFGNGTTPATFGVANGKRKYDRGFVDLVTEGEIMFPLTLVPTKIIQRIMTHSISERKKLAQLVTSKLEKYETRDEKLYTSYCSGKKSQFMCANLQAGMLLRAANLLDLDCWAQGIPPVGDAGNVCWNTLRKALLESAELSAKIFQEDIQGHEQCDPFAGRLVEAFQRVDEIQGLSLKDLD